ncbi:MAG: NAD-dependent succinate-semialdehyde dehydrogenase [Nitrospirota bacterium]|nr:NAD-dependent succinate-semialdehyde dehydrogenase [Nitrospirota bacterium]
MRREKKNITKKRRAIKKAKTKAVAAKKAARTSSPRKGAVNMKVRSLRAYKEQKVPGGVMQSVNPFTEEVLHELPLMSRAEITSLAAKARHACWHWRNVPIGERTALLKKLAEVLRSEKRNYAGLITQEMGKPIKDAMAEVEKCAVLADYFSENAARFLEPEMVKTEARKSYVAFEPLGVILAIEPWNFPFWQVFRVAVPGLVAGNAVLLKHASNVPMTALAIEDAIRKAGFPENLFKTLLISPDDAMKLIDDDLVDAVSLTGSNRAGEEVGSRAGRRIKSLVLELGGSDPFIVLDDADAAKAGRTAAQARMINAGQSCIASKRFIVMENVAEEFTRNFISRLKELKVGDPMDETTDIGPLARKDILDGLKAQLKDAKAKGAEVIELAHDQTHGYFMAPVVVLKPTANMKVLSEEVFGPIAPIVVVKDEDEAVRVANDTEYGLGASIWSRNIERAEKLARRIEAGTIAINDFVKSDPRLPFGGVKKSGVGRELSQYGLKELVNIKTVVVRE